MDVSGLVTLEISGSVSLGRSELAGRSISDLSISTRGSDGRFITVFSGILECEGPKTSCATNLTTRRDLNVVSGQEIFVSASTQGTLFCQAATFSGNTTFTVEVIKGLKLEKVSGDGQEGVMETTLSETLVVKVTDSAGNPKEGVAINWGITKVPDGAKGAVLRSPDSTTNEDGLAGAFLTLGDTEGDYQVTATCPDCTSGSPQVFTAKAKCAVAENAISPRAQCASGVGDQQYDTLILHKTYLMRNKFLKISSSDSV